MWNRRRFHAALAGTLVAGAGRAQGPAARWPERTVRLVLPFGAGNSLDHLARLLAERFTEGLQQTVIVENQPGAAGAMAVDRVSRSVPDGHTLVLAGDAAITYNVFTPERPRFDPRRDLAPISQVAIWPNVLVVGIAHEAKSLPELIALARERPGQLSYASAGIGTSQHRAGELLARLAGIDLLHVPYGQTSTTAGDVMSGRVTMWFVPPPGALQMVRSGRARALAVSSLARLDDAPEWPTVAEAAGLPGFEAVAWFGLLAPAGTPGVVIDRVHAETVTALRQPAVREWARNGQVQLVGGTPAEFAAVIQADLVRWQRVKG